MDSRSLEYNVIVVKWGNKFTSEHVNRIYRMAKRNITLPFNFYCYTEDPAGICDEVNIIPLDTSLGLEKWWWKLTLFKKNNLGNGVNLFLDLDVVIQSNINHFFIKAKHNKIILISQDHDNWHISTPLNYDPKTAPAYNSSIMIWYNNELTNIYQNFSNNKSFFQSFYYGIDRFFTYEIPSSYFLSLDYKDYYYRTIKRENEIYEQSYYIRLHNPTVLYPKPGRVEVFFNRNIPICVFNGCHEDVFYQGMENFLL
jgi:hypothetical protein